MAKHHDLKKNSNKYRGNDVRQARTAQSVVTYFRRYTPDEVASIRAEAHTMGMYKPYLDTDKIPCCTSKNTCVVHGSGVRQSDPVQVKPIGYVNYYSGVSLDISELKSPSRPPDCTAENHNWGDYADFRECHSNRCEHVRCGICNLEKITYSIQLHNRQGLGKDLMDAGIWPGITIIDWTYEIPSVEVTRYIQRSHRRPR